MHEEGKGLNRIKQSFKDIFNNEKWKSKWKSKSDFLKEHKVR